MNKVNLAKVLSLLLGIFLVVITAIKFDWMGMIKRGDAIIQINTEKKVEKNENPQEEQSSEENESPRNEVEISCTKATSENNLFVTNTLNAYFVDDVINTTTLDVKATYSDPTGKASFDTLVNNYTNLYTKYNGIEGVSVSIVPGTTEFQYHQDIYYGSVNETNITEKGLSGLETAKDTTLDVLEKTYTSQGYTCTQH